MHQYISLILGILYISICIIEVKPLQILKQ